RGNGSVRWTHEGGTLTSGVLDRIICSPQLAANGVVRHFREVGMRPAVVANFMSLTCSARHNLGMFGHVLPDHEERNLNMVRGQEVQQFWGESRAWPVIKGHRDVGSIDVYRIERDARFRSCGCIFGILRCRNGFEWEPEDGR